MSGSWERIAIAALTIALGGQTVYSKTERDNISTDAQKGSAACDDIERLRDDILEFLTLRPMQGTAEQERLSKLGTRIFRRPACQ